MEWQNFFQEVPDFRKENGFKLHLLEDILMLSVCAVLSGAENDEEIETYGREKISFLQTFLSLPYGIPSHDTFTRVFRFLDKEKFAACLYAHSQALLDFMEEYHLSIDGKICRGTGKKGKKRTGICIVTAWACEQNLVLGQIKTEEKSNEKTAIPALLAELDLQDALVSIDAIANQPKIAKQITDKGGHYLLSLKKNQKKAFEQVADFMQNHLPLCEVAKSLDFGAGRIETRTCYVCPKVELMEAVLAWQNVQSVIMIQAKREIGNEIQEEYRFYLSDKAENAEYFNRHIRGHWSIENQLHWHLDVSFQEDKSRTKMGNGAENHNTLRKIALQILKMQNDKHSIIERRKKAGWNDTYLLDVLKNLRF